MTSLPVQQYLDSFINHEIHLDQVRTSSFKLDRVRQLLKGLGDPHKDLKVVHVAGSKGKGSICALISSILHNVGYKVGLYTSPHIDNYRERIRVLEPAGPNSKQASVISESKGADIFPDCISEEELGAIIEEIKPDVEKIRSREDLGILSFFEVYTVLALYYFHKRKVDLVVLETGLGGRLDATNAVKSLIAVIAPISLEHTNILGGTIKQIAEEKAGIIKDRDQKVVIAPQTPEAQDVLRKRCHKFNIAPSHVGDIVEYKKVAQDIDGQIFDLTIKGAIYRQISLPLLGKHQRENVATSICVIEYLKEFGFIVPADALWAGCKNIFWPGRTEIIRRDPLIVLDSAHNTASAQALSETMQEILGGKKIVLILGVSKDKDKELILDELKKIVRKIIYTKADHPRASDLEGSVDVQTALELARRETGQKDVILVTGSVFVVSEARRHLLNEGQTLIKMGR